LTHIFDQRAPVGEQLHESGDDCLQQRMQLLAFGHTEMFKARHGVRAACLVPSFA
jgi:hypothetical protein